MPVKLLGGTMVYRLDNNLVLRINHYYVRRNPDLTASDVKFCKKEGEFYYFKLLNSDQEFGLLEDEVKRVIRIN